MSAKHLTVLTHPSFPQVFKAAISQEVNRVVARAVAHSQLSTCSREFPESAWGAGDAIPCNRKATIYDLATEREFCFQCWREVGRG